MTITVRTQAELDAAVADAEPHIIIDSPAGVWLTLQSDPTKSHIEAWGRSHIQAWEQSHIVAWGSSTVMAQGQSHVVARGHSHIDAWGQSHVEAGGQSTVEAWESSTVVAWGSSTVMARGQSHIDARESSTVDARGQSHVVARESSHVEAWGSSTVEAGSHVAVHVHSARATISGGVIIDLTTLDYYDPATWLAYHGVTVANGKATVYKAVDSNLHAGHCHTLTAYPIGETVTADDWADSGTCGRGLHFGVSPLQARAYYSGRSEPRYLAVEVDADGVVPLDDKCKARSCRVLYEVDLHGDRVDAKAVSA